MDLEAEYMEYSGPDMGGRRAAGTGKEVPTSSSISIPYGGAEVSNSDLAVE